MNDDLPPLPEPTQGLGVHRWAYSDDDMRAYALAARDPIVAYVLVSPDGVPTNIRMDTPGMVVNLGERWIPLRGRLP